MLYRAVALLDQSAAVECFPMVENVALHPKQPDVASQTVGLRTEEGRQILLLACHCYHEFCCSNGCSPVLPSLVHDLGRTGWIDLFCMDLTGADCKAVGHVLQVYNSMIDKVDFNGCRTGDTGYTRLSAGLQSCKNLTWLMLMGNNLTDHHQDHISEVILNNSTTLRWLSTYGNQFTSDGNAGVHRHTNLCHKLELLDIGGPKCMNCTLNHVTISSILDACKRIRYFGLFDFALHSCAVTKLLAALSSLMLESLFIEKIGLTAQHTSAVNHLLQQQYTHLQLISLSGNSLTSTFFDCIRGSFRLCSQLEEVQFWEYGLSSACFPVLVSLLRYWPRLKAIWLMLNDFRDLPDAASEFVDALRSCESLEDLRVPSRDSVHPGLISKLEALSSPEVKVQFCHSLVT